MGSGPPLKGALGHHNHVPGLDAVPLPGQEGPGAAHASLHLIQNKQSSMLLTELFGSGQISPPEAKRFLLLP